MKAEDAVKGKGELGHQGSESRGKGLHMIIDELRNELLMGDKKTGRGDWSFSSVCQVFVNIIKSSVASQSHCHDTQKKSKRKTKTPPRKGKQGKKAV